VAIENQEDGIVMWVGYVIKSKFTNNNYQMKMKIHFLLMPFLLAFINLNGQDVSLVEQWASETKFDVPESALFSHTENLIFVSNISGKPSEKDGNGFISTMSLSGKIFNLRWVEGLNAPKGMALVGKKLFVSDIDELVEIEVDERRIINRYAAPQSKFLNDVAEGPRGSVFVSDMNDQAIYVLENGHLKKWLSSDALKGVNGITVLGDTLFAGTPNGILSISITDLTIEVWAAGTGSIDGLEWDGEAAFVYSDWKGQVFSITKGGQRKLLLDTTQQSVNAADIGYNKAKKIIYVPTFFNNRVVAYKLD
jgi:hypothetical protein